MALGSGHKPDITFSYLGENDVGFVADITTVSDEGLHNRNPIFQFHLQISALAKSIGLNANHLHVDVSGVTTGPYGYQKTRLLLPRQADIADFLDSRILPFLREIRENQLEKHELSIHEERINILVTYDSSRLYGGGGHPSYNIPRSPKNNPLWNRLRGKVAQLAGAPTGTPTGIIVCDGGCHLLQSRTRSHDSFTSSDVVITFLHEFPAISFVVLITVDMIETSLHTKDYSIRAQCFVTDDTAAVVRAKDVLSKMLDDLPKPVIDPLNAYHRSREEGYDLGHLGGHMTDGRSVRMSSREIQDILAGRRTVSQVNELHGWRKLSETENKQINPFERSLAEGRVITGSCVAQDENGDDGWITFEFGAPDPAISPFVVPRERKARS